VAAPLAITRAALFKYAAEAAYLIVASRFPKCGFQANVFDNELWDGYNRRAVRSFREQPLQTIVKIIQLARILACIVVAGMVTAAANGQVVSQNIVGYVNLTLDPGTNFIANQFDNGEGNTLDTLFTQTSGSTGGPIPEGTMFTELNSTTGQFLPVSTYDSVNGWSINYALTYGEGAMLIAPTLCTNTFVGNVLVGDPGINPPAQPFIPPLITGSGLMFLSCVDPIGDATFYDVIGRNPQNGEWVTMLNPQTQVYTTTTFEDGAWNNGTPELNVGESALYFLEPAPEPSVACLGAVGLLAMALRRQFGAKFG
jgi:hypothetical protein